MRNDKNNFIDSFVNLFRKFKIFNPLISIYDNYREAILYLFFGALTTFTNIIIYTLLAKALKIEYMLSNVIAWIGSVVFAYITNKLYVFESNTNTKRELIMEISAFFTARVLSLVLDIAIMYLGISILHFNDLAVKIISNVLVIIANYFMSKIFVFKNKE